MALSEPVIGLRYFVGRHTLFIAIEISQSLDKKALLCDGVTPQNPQTPTPSGGGGRGRAPGPCELEGCSQVGRQGSWSFLCKLVLCSPNLQGAVLSVSVTHACEGSHKRCGWEHRGLSTVPLTWLKGGSEEPDRHASFAGHHHHLRQRCGSSWLGSLWKSSVVLGT